MNWRTIVRVLFVLLAFAGCASDNGDNQRQSGQPEGAVKFSVAWPMQPNVLTQGQLQAPNSSRTRWLIPFDTEWLRVRVMRLSDGLTVFVDILRPSAEC